MDDDGRLVLQIFPRNAPDRALTYSGDQQYIRSVMEDITRRLETGGGRADDPMLSLLEDEEGDDD